MDCDVQI